MACVVTVVQCVLMNFLCPSCREAVIMDWGRLKVAPNMYTLVTPASVDVLSFSSVEAPAHLSGCTVSQGRQGSARQQRPLAISTVTSGHHSRSPSVGRKRARPELASLDGCCIRAPVEPQWIERVHITGTWSPRWFLRLRHETQEVHT